MKDKALKITALIVCICLCLAGCGDAGKSADNEAAGASGAPVQSQTGQNGESSGQAPGEAAGNDDARPGFGGVRGEYKGYIGEVFYLTEDVSFTADGEVFDDQGFIMEPVTDVATEETVYYRASKMEIPQETYQDYFFGVVPARSELYDTDGNLLEPLENYTYYCAMGSLVVRSETYDGVHPAPELFDYSQLDSCLYDPIAHEAVMEDVGSVTAFGDLYIVTDRDGLLKGFMNADGEKVHGFPMDGDYAYEYSDGTYIQLREGEAYRKPVYMDSGLNILRDENHDFYTDQSLVSGGFIRCTSRGETAILSLPDFTEVFRTDGFLNYFDGGLAIISNGEFCYLEALDGEVLAGPFESLVAGCDHDVTGTEFFYGIFEDDLRKIDRSGELVAQIHMGGLYDVWYTRGLLNVSVINDVCEYGQLMFDEELNLLTKDENYNSVGSLYYYVDGGEFRDMIYAGYTTPFGSFRTDIIDRTGTVRIKGLRSFGGAGEELIAVKGRYAGFMDADGNWIKKVSIYQTDYVKDK